MGTERLCWWCNIALKNAGTVAHDHEGNEVRVHKGCKDAAENERRPYTVNPLAFEEPITPNRYVPY